MSAYLPAQLKFTDITAYRRNEVFFDTPPLIAAIHEWNSKKAITGTAQ